MKNTQFNIFQCCIYVVLWNIFTSFYRRSKKKKSIVGFLFSLLLSIQSGAFLIWICSFPFSVVLWILLCVLLGMLWFRTHPLCTGSLWIWPVFLKYSLFCLLSHRIWEHWMCLTLSINPSSNSKTFVFIVPCRKLKIITELQHLLEKVHSNLISVFTHLKSSFLLTITPI